MRADLQYLLLANAYRDFLEIKHSDVCSVFFGHDQSNALLHVVQRSIYEKNKSCIGSNGNGNSLFIAVDFKMSLSLNISNFIIVYQSQTVHREM